MLINRLKKVKRRPHITTHTHKTFNTSLACIVALNTKTVQVPMISNMLACIHVCMYMCVCVCG